MTRARPHRVGFPAFWTAALLSNTLGAAQTVVIAWELGNPDIPVQPLLVMQVLTTVGSFGSVAVGARLLIRMPASTVVVLAAVLEALACGLLAGWAWLFGTTETIESAVALGVLGALPAVFAALGGPAWVSIVSGWPGAASARSRLLYDNAQYQLASVVAPLVATSVIASPVLGLPAVAALNLIASALIAVIIALRRNDVPRERQSAPAQRGGWRVVAQAVRSLPVTAIIVAGLVASPIKFYLPRLLRSSGESAIVLSTALIVLAVAGLVAIIGATRITLQDRTLTIICFGISATGLACWMFAPNVGLVLWLSGALCLGLSTGVAHATLLSLSIPNSEDRREAALGAATLVRTGANSISGLLTIPLLAAFGSLALAVPACLCLVAISTISRTRTSPPESDANESP